MIGRHVLFGQVYAAIVAAKIAAVHHAAAGIRGWRPLSALSRRSMFGCRTGHPDPLQTSAVGEHRTMASQLWRWQTNSRVARIRVYFDRAMATQTSATMLGGHNSLWRSSLLPHSQQRSAFPRRAMHRQAASLLNGVVLALLSPGVWGKRPNDKVCVYSPDRGGNYCCGLSAGKPKRTVSTKFQSAVSCRHQQSASDNADPVQSRRCA